MIKLVRVDDRLIHGQVALTWTSFLSADTIVVANDKYAKDSFLSMTLTLGKPPGVDLQVLSLVDAATFCNNPENNSRKIFIVIESTADALELARSIPEIDKIILGGIRSSPGKKRIERQVFLDQQDLDNCDEMVKLNKTVNVQVIPSEKEYSLADAKKIFQKR